MTLEVGLPTNAVSANSGNAFGRKSGRAASVDTDFSGVMGGFGAVLARVDDSIPAIEDTDGARDRRRKSSEANVSPDVPAPNNQEVSDPSAKGVGSETASATKLAEDQRSLTSDERLGGDLAEQDLPTVGAIVLDTAKFAAGSMQDLDADLRKTVLHTDIRSYAEIVESALKGVQESSLDAAKALSHSATPVPGNSGLVATKLSGGLAIAKTKLGKEKISDDLPQSIGVVTANGAALRPDDGGVRARIFQEIKLLTQQASLSREVIDPLQHGVVEFGLPKYVNATTELNLTASEPLGDASGQGAELSTPSDSAASAPLDGFLATTADMEASGSYWISGDLKNAKLKLGDATDGVVEVSIQLQGNQAQVVFKADEALTRNALQNSGSELKEMLRRDGIELSGVSVGTSGAGDGGGDRERSGSENPRSTRREVVTANLESPTLTGLNSGVQRLDLFV